MTERPFGVNVFVPSKEVVDEKILSAYREKIEKEAESVGASIGEADSDDDDWVNKLAVLKEAPGRRCQFYVWMPYRQM